MFRTPANAGGPPRGASPNVQEILTRLPPDEPQNLLRTTLVCSRIVCNDGTHCAYRAHHRSPPVMGFVVNVQEETDLVRLALTTRFIPWTMDHEDLDVLDTRRARVLLHSLFLPNLSRCSSYGISVTHIGR